MGQVRFTILTLVFSFVGCGTVVDGPTEDAPSLEHHVRPPISTVDSPSSSVRAEFEQMARRLKSGTNLYLGAGRLEQLRVATTRPRLELEPRLRAKARAKAHALYAVGLLQFGRVDESLAEVDKAFSIATREFGSNLPPHFYRFRALVYLRQAELQNCVAHHNAECCLFPLRGGGLHLNRKPALMARADYEHFLKLVPEDNGIRLLLNVVNMALGEYPDGVPIEHRLPPESFESDMDVGRFHDIAGRLGIDCFNHCGGAIMEDFDGDNLLDIVTSTIEPNGPVTFYRNQGDGTFEDRSAPSELDQQLGGLNCIGADYNNDGHRDILLLRGAWLFEEGQIRNSLVKNNGNGKFTDVTYEAGIALPACPTQAACWGDFDLDGFIDLFVGNESRVGFGEPKGDYPSQLFRNNGNGTFTDIAVEAGVTNDRYCKAVGCGDYDNDGDLDLYVSNVGPNRLYRNDGDGTFTDMAPELGLVEPSGRSFASWFWDYDNDGWLDLFVSSYQAEISDIFLDLVGKAHNGNVPCFYHNNGDGTFTDVATETNLAHPWLPMGANFGDIDHDGFLDIYLGTGQTDYQSLMPNVLLRNDAGKRFVNVTTSSGMGHLQKGHGIAFGDFDHDGDQDIYHQVGGFYPGDAFRNVCFQNPGNENHFAYIQLRGEQTNRDGLGARIRLIVEAPDDRRWEIHRAVGSVSSFGGSPSRQEIGLGTAHRIVELEVYWPCSKKTDRFTDLPIDRHFTVSEGSPDVEILELEPIEF